MISKLALAVMTGNIVENPTFEIYVKDSYFEGEGAQVIFIGMESACLTELQKMDQKIYAIRPNGQYFMSLNNMA